MRKALIIALLLSCFGVKSQKFTDLGSKWTLQNQEYDVQVGRPNSVYYNYVINDSAFFQGVKYYELSGHPPRPSFRQPVDVIIRSSGKKVYARLDDTSGRDTSEFLLYDFGLALGDTINLRFLALQDTTHYHRKFKVVHKDSIIIQKGKVLRLQLQDLSPNIGCYSGWGDTVLTWLEGVGCTVGPFYPIDASACQGLGVTWYNRLVCKSEDTSMVYKPFGVCSGLSATRASLQEELEIYPNPSSGHFKVEIAPGVFNSGLYYQIYHSSGQMIQSAPLYNRTVEIDIDTGSGIYLFRLLNQTGLIHHQKLLIR